MRPDGKMSGGDRPLDTGGAESAEEREQRLRDQLENMDFQTLDKAMKDVFGEDSDKKWIGDLNADEMSQVVAAAEKNSSKEKKKVKNGRFGVAVLVGAMALSGVVSGFLGSKLGGNRDAKAEATTQERVEPDQAKYDDALTEMGVTEVTSETQEDQESLRDRMTYHGKFANEDGTDYNKKKRGGDYNFGVGPENVAEMTSDELKESFKSGQEQRAQLAHTYVVLLHDTEDPNFPVAGYENWTNINELTKLMHEDPELEQKIYDAVMKYVDGDEELGTSTDAKPVLLNGTKKDAYMDYDFKSGVDIDEADAKVVVYDDTKVDAPGMVMTHVYYVDGEQHTDETEWLADCNWQRWTDIPEIDSDIPPVKTEEPPTEEPTEEPTTEEPPTEEPTEEPTTETPPPSDAKKPFDQQGVDQGMGDTHITPTTQQDEVESTPSTEGYKKPYIPEANNNGDRGEEQNDVAPDSNTHTGAQNVDTERSRDDTGRTVRQVTQEAETSSANGTNTQQQRSGSERDAQVVQTREQQRQEQETYNSDTSQTHGGDANRNASDEQVRNYFENGDF